MENIVVYILFVLLVTLLVLNITISTFNKSEMIYVHSDIDNMPYLVRNNKDKRQASNMLASLKRDIFTLSKHMSARKDTKEYVEFKPYIEQLERNLVNVEIRESSSNTVHTSYTVNKGEQVVFCLRSKEISQYLKTSNIHDKNVIMYVALHEIAHVACPEYQHTPLFMKIFKFFTEVAIDIGLYDKIEFDITPHEYCGIMISESIV